MFVLLHQIFLNCLYSGDLIGCLQQHEICAIGLSQEPEGMQEKLPYHAVTASPPRPAETPFPITQY